MSRRPSAPPHPGADALRAQLEAAAVTARSYSLHELRKPLAPPDSKSVGVKGGGASEYVHKTPKGPGPQGTFPPPSQEEQAKEQEEFKLFQANRDLVSGIDKIDLKRIKDALKSKADPNWVINLKKKKPPQSETPTADDLLGEDQDGLPELNVINPRSLITPFLRAVEKGIIVLTAVVENTTKPIDVNQYNGYPLIVALSLKREDEAKLLLTRPSLHEIDPRLYGYDPDQTETPLEIAQRQKMSKALIHNIRLRIASATAQSTVSDPDLNKVLWTRAGNGTTEEVEIDLYAGADPNFRYATGFTGLFGSGAPDNKTVLTQACLRDDDPAIDKDTVDIVKLLLKWHARLDKPTVFPGERPDETKQVDVNALDGQALRASITQTRPALVKLLLDDKRTIVTEAHVENAQKQVKLLNPEFEDDDEPAAAPSVLPPKKQVEAQKLLEKAVSDGSLQDVKDAIEKEGADPSIVVKLASGSRTTFLHLAIQRTKKSKEDIFNKFDDKRDLAIVKYLLTQKGDPNFATKDNPNVPLWEALLSGEDAMAVALIDDPRVTLAKHKVHGSVVLYVVNKVAAWAEKAKTGKMGALELLDDWEKVSEAIKRRLAKDKAAAAAPKEADPDAQERLKKAIYMLSLQNVKSAIEAGADPSAVLPDGLFGPGEFPLNYAVQHRAFEVVEYLLTLDIDPNAATDYYKTSALQYALVSAATEMSKDAYRILNVLVADKRVTVQPDHLAYAANQVELSLPKSVEYARWVNVRDIMEVILEEQKTAAAPKKVDKDAQARLQKAIGDQSLQNVKSAIEAGADPNAVLPQGLFWPEMLPLKYAVRLEAVEVVKYLLTLDIDPNAAADDKNTSPLKHAIVNAKTMMSDESYGILVALLADERVTVQPDLVPYAVDKLDVSLPGSQQYRRWLDVRDTMEAKLQNQKAAAAPKEADPGAQERLKRAIAKGSVQDVKSAIKEGADPNALVPGDVPGSGDGLTPLAYAVTIGALQMVEYLLTLDIDVNVVNTSSTKTSLYYALYYAGGDMNARSNGIVLALLDDKRVRLQPGDLQYAEQRLKEAAADNEKGGKIRAYRFDNWSRIVKIMKIKTNLQTLDAKEAKLKKQLFEEDKGPGAGPDQELLSMERLREAIYQSDLKRVRKEIEAGADPGQDLVIDNGYTVTYTTPLNLAVERGLLEIVKYLLTLDIDPNALPSRTSPVHEPVPLWTALLGKELDIARALLEDDRVKLVDDKILGSALSYAEKQYDLAKKTYVDTDDSSVEKAAKTEYRSWKEVVRQIKLKAGRTAAPAAAPGAAPAEAPVNPSGPTAPQQPPSSGEIKHLKDAVEILAALVAHLKAQKEEAATKAAEEKAAKELVEKAAKEAAAKEEAKKQEALSEIYRDLFLAIDRGDVNAVKTLLEKEHKVDGKKLTLNLNEAFDRKSVVVQAVFANVPQVLRILLKDYQPEVNLWSGKGRTPLLLAAMYGHLEIVQILVLLGNANVNLQSKQEFEDWTPLHAAARYGYFDIVKYLVDQRANAALRNSQGKTAFLLARDMGYRNIAQYLYGKTPEEGRLPRDVDPATSSIADLKEGKSYLGLAVHAWMSSWYGFLKEYQKGTKWETYMRPGGPFETKIDTHMLAIYFAFCPWIELDKALGSLLGAARSLYGVKKSAGNDCNLRLMYRQDPDTWVSVSAEFRTKLKAELMLPLVRPTSVTAARRRELFQIWNETLGRLNDALTSSARIYPSPYDPPGEATGEFSQPRTLWRSIKLAEKPVKPGDVIFTENHATNWIATSKSKATSTSVFGTADTSRPHIVVMEIIVGYEGVLAVDTLRRLPPHWRCFDEKEIVIAPGATWTIREWKTTGERKYYLKVEVTGGLRPRWRAKAERWMVS